MTALDWLMDSDPAIRWQAMRDLTHEPADVVAAERSRVASRGWGAALLALQGADGYWSQDDPGSDWISFRALLLLRDMGLDPASREARRAVALVRDNVTWRAPGEPWNGGSLLTGEVEPCINGRVVAIGSYFGQDVQGVVDLLLGEQMADGGWNCEQEHGSTRGSFHTTINVLEGLLEFERSQGGAPEARASRERGEEYLLERRMFRRRSTGEVIDPAFTQFLFPSGYHFDVLRGLDHLRSTGLVPEERLRGAIDLVTSKRDPGGRWPLENVHPDETFFDLGEREGKPSRWNTLRAMRVLAWYENGPRQ